MYVETKSIQTAIKADFFVDEIDISKIDILSFNAKNFFNANTQDPIKYDELRIDDLPPVVLLCTGAFSTNTLRTFINDGDSQKDARVSGASCSGWIHLSVT